MVMVQDNVMEESVFFVNFETRGITWLWNAKPAVVAVMIAMVCSSKFSSLMRWVGGIFNNQAYVKCEYYD